jgi:hypothetical protein
MSRRSAGIVIVMLAALACLPATALADNTTCANADFLFMGIGRGQTITNGTSRYYKVRVVAGRSYSVYSWAPFQDVGDGGATIDHILYEDSACTTAASTVSTAAKEPTAVVTGHSGDNDTIIPDFTGTLYIRVANNDTTSYTIFTAIQETTIFSPWWFVGGAYNAFAELKNATNASIAYTLTARTAGGGTCGTSSGAILANGNTAINIRTLGTCLASVSGSVDVAFQGPPGAIIGNITTIDGTQGVSFDAPFSPRMPWALSTQ